MILAKAPLRVSLFGGGTDIPAFYTKYTGATISMAIDKYVYVTVMHTPHDHVKVTYSKTELVDTAADVKNDIVREALCYFGISKNIEITTFADIPTIGTGLGGSSAFTCALVAALGEYTDAKFSKYDIAEIACHIELTRCKWNIGKQDQYASAFGGMNYIEYKNYDNGENPGEDTSDIITVTSLNSQDISYYCLLIPTNITRHSSDIIDSIDFVDKESLLRGMASITTLLKDSPPSFKLYSKYLNNAWESKKKLSSSISTNDIDSMIVRCIDNDASACKLLGAGGGGFMLALTDNRDKLKQIFNDRVCIEFRIAQNGAQVVYRD